MGYAKNEFMCLAKGCLRRLDFLYYALYVIFMMIAFIEGLIYLCKSSHVISICIHVFILTLQCMLTSILIGMWEVFIVMSACLKVIYGNIFWLQGADKSWKVCLIRVATKACGGANHINLAVGDTKRTPSIGIKPKQEEMIQKTKAKAKMLLKQSKIKTVIC